jgi:hypothetical protein
MTPSLLVLSFKKANARLAGVSLSYFVFECRSEQINNYAQRPGYSDSDPRLVDSVYVVEKACGDCYDKNQTD